MHDESLIARLSGQRAETLFEAIHHAVTALLTSSLAWLTIYNANFDPLRFRPLPKSLTLAVLLIPLCMINTRVIGQGKWHFTSFNVAPFFNPSLVTEVLFSLVVLILAICRYWVSGSRGWADAVLKTLPIYFSLLQYLALTPIFSDHQNQNWIVYVGTLVDFVLYTGIPVWGAGYGVVLALRIVWWGMRSLLEILQWIWGIVGL
ncbi:hypothetical protein PILCRDRAFT_828853 [Piloderma croceum F 1598]|uniref:Uncharacterized protein n=1 Tax=Piloderma croceum (strain F 1598) TaxID=765440 RepID=A0A0C3AIR8_PILCF|nr:hypothetical protein PILCRDRAFT_828853 [Piloderma croceum F 1598]